MLLYISAVPVHVSSSSHVNGMYSRHVSQWAQQNGYIIGHTGLLFHSYLSVTAGVVAGFSIMLSQMTVLGSCHSTKPPRHNPPFPNRLLHLSAQQVHNVNLSHRYAYEVGAPVCVISIPYNARTCSLCGDLQVPSPMVWSWAVIYKQFVIFDINALS